MKLITTVLFGFLVLVSCQKPKNQDSLPEIPVSIASADDAREITETVSEIQQFSNNLGINANFNQFPIRVVEAYPGPGEALAFCQQDKDENGIYIGILKSTMESYRSYFKPTSGNSTLFLLLTHEFGHCLFKRKHDEENIGVTGLNFYFRSQQGTNDYNLVGGELPVSAMTSAVYKPSSIYMPIGVREYYIAEIAGLRRWKNKADLENTKDLKLSISNP